MTEQTEIEAARADERERCARIAEDLPKKVMMASVPLAMEACKLIAATIRAPDAKN
jgi:hypothetical protein